MAAIFLSFDSNLIYLTATSTGQVYTILWRSFGATPSPKPTITCCQMWIWIQHFSIKRLWTDDNDLQCIKPKCTLALYIEFKLNTCLKCVHQLTHWPLGNLNVILQMQSSILLYWLVSSNLFYESVLRWMPHDLTDDKSTLVQVMAWWRQPLPEPMLTKISNAIWRHYTPNELM